MDSLHDPGLQRSCHSLESHNTCDSLAEAADRVYMHMARLCKALAAGNSVPTDRDWTRGTVWHAAGW